MKPSNDKLNDIQKPRETNEFTSKTASGKRKGHNIRSGLSLLSRLFKQYGSTSAVQPHIKDKLQKSVRQHLNTALRLARQGDINNAKLYADLTSNAMQQLVFYMPQEDFV